MSVVCGTTAGAADSKISNQPFTFESNQIGIVRFEFESNLEASQVPMCHIKTTRVKNVLGVTFTFILLKYK